MTRKNTQIIYDMTPEEYHARPEASKSDLDLITPDLRRTPADYRWRKDHPTERKTPALTLGTAVHMAVLEPKKFPSAYMLAPECDRRTKEGKAIYEEELSSGKILLDVDQYTACLGMAKSVSKHPVMADALRNRSKKVELSLFWTHEGTGEPCKARLDYYNGRGLMDLKTTSDASNEGIERSIKKYRYHVQAGFYRKGIEVITGKTLPFMFCFVENKPPYKVNVGFVSDEDMDAGYAQAERDLQILHSCKESGTWSGYSSELQVWRVPPTPIISEEGEE